jgi:NADH dehydrogenase
MSLWQFCRGVKGLPGAIEPIDWTTKTLTLDGGRFTHTYAVSFDRLVLALGSVTDLSAGPGLANYGRPGRFSVGETLNAQFAGVRTGFYRAL